MKLNRKIKTTQKLKDKKIYLVIFILIGCFNLKLRENTPLLNEIDSNPNIDFIFQSSASNSSTIEWLRLGDWRGGVGGKGVAVDSSDNVYILGHKGYLDYVWNKVENFLVKYDSSGEQQWKYKWDADYLEANGGVAVDSGDNIYVAGGRSEGYLIKFDSSGQQLWNCTWSGEWGDGGYVPNRVVVVDSSNNVYLAGSQVLVKYDSSGVQQWNRTNDYEIIGVAVDSSDDLYLAGSQILGKYDNSGEQQWIRTSDYEIEGVTVDSSDNVYLTGSIDIFEVGSTDIFLVKYDSSGVQQWYRTWDGSDYDEGSGVVVDSFDNVYLTGSMNSVGAGENGMVLIKYDSSGEQQWDYILGDMKGSGYGNGVAVDSSDNVYIAGSMLWGKTVLVKHIISNITINSPKQLDFFGNIPPSFDISTFDSNSTWYSLDGGLVNKTFSGSIGSIDQAEWDKQADGVVFIRFYMNNTLGKEEFVEVSVIKDTVKPKITIISPIQNQTYGYEPPSYIFSIEESNFQSYWIGSWDFVPDNISQVSKTISQSDWYQTPQGEVSITIYAEDITGKIGSATITFFKSVPFGPPLRQTFSYFPLILLIIIPFAGVAIYFIVKNRKLPKITQEELDPL
ncbi:MAG: outer membrane protein assembly factor BamB family protein [Promethearchaeota archaeon]